MTKSWLLVGDLHLTAQPRDVYRWSIFQTIRDELQRRKYTGLVLLGDISDQKDNHGAQLVNKVCAELCALSEVVTAVHVLRGNHDGIDPRWPYFRFVGSFPRIHFYAEPLPLESDGKPSRILMLPHSRNPLRDWSAIRWRDYDTALAHVTVKGAVSESGSELDSVVGSDYFRKRHIAVFAGDVHVPQAVGPVLYVGAPYPIRFGDSFAPRTVRLFDDGSYELLELKPPLQRHMLDVKDAHELHSFHSLHAGDQAKIRLHLAEDQLHTWVKQRKTIVAFCRERKLDLVDVRIVKEEGVDTKPVPQRVHAKHPLEMLQEYVDERKVADRLAAVGRSLVMVEHDAGR